MLKCGRDTKILSFSLVALAPTVAMPLLCSKPSLDLIGWLRSIFGNLDYVIDQRGYVPGGVAQIVSA